MSTHFLPSLSPWSVHSGLLATKAIPEKMMPTFLYDKRAWIGLMQEQTAFRVARPKVGCDIKKKILCTVTQRLEVHGRNSVGIWAKHVTTVQQGATKGLGL